MVRGVARLTPVPALQSDTAPNPALHTNLLSIFHSWQGDLKLVTVSTTQFTYNCYVCTSVVRSVQLPNIRSIKESSLEVARLFILPYAYTTLVALGSIQ